jgi:hypothetical protein
MMNRDRYNFRRFISNNGTKNVTVHEVTSLAAAREIHDRVGHNVYDFHIIDECDEMVYDNNASLAKTRAFAEHLKDVVQDCCMLGLSASCIVDDSTTGCHEK